VYRKTRRHNIVHSVNRTVQSPKTTQNQQKRNVGTNKTVKSNATVQTVVFARTIKSVVTKTALADVKITIRKLVWHVKTSPSKKMV
jgi:hypothetical protein